MKPTTQQMTEQFSRIKFRIVFIQNCFSFDVHSISSIHSYVLFVKMGLTYQILSLFITGRSFGLFLKKMNNKQTG